MSRYPAFGPSALGYDETLLQIAPQVTKADRQQGYSVDILEQGANHQYNPNAPRRQPIAQGYEPYRFQQRHLRQQPSYPYDQSVPPSLEKADYYSSSSSSTGHQRDIFTINPYEPEPEPKKPWFRTKRGLLILFVITLVVAGSVVGIVFGVRSAMNKANPDAQRSAQSGSGGGEAETSGVARDGGAVTTNDSNARPSFSSLSLLTLGTARQPAATTTSQVNRVNAAPASPTRPAVTTPPRTTGTTLPA